MEGNIVRDMLVMVKSQNDSIIKENYHSIISGQ
jgi:hypothetical protein